MGLIKKDKAKFVEKKFRICLRKVAWGFFGNNGVRKYRNLVQ